MEKESLSWVLFVDGSSNLKGSGASIILKGPEGIAFIVLKIGSDQSVEPVESGTAQVSGLVMLPSGLKNLKGGELSSKVFLILFAKILFS